MEKIVVLGASSGLGKDIVQGLAQKSEYQFFLFSRKESLLKELSSVIPNSYFESFDFTQKESQVLLMEKLRDIHPDHIIYSAGGGPYGNFEDKKWSSQMWTFELNFLFPSYLIYECLKPDQFLNLRNFVYIGSAIAEENPDAGAASYAGCKHAMRGLITSIQNESRTKETQVRIFSPPYMDTPMLPSNAWPRQQGIVQKTSRVAEVFCEWFFSDKLNMKW